MQVKVIQWDFDAWEEYLYWQSQDKKTLKRINQLIKDIKRNPFDGIGKPKPLKGQAITNFQKIGHTKMICSLLGRQVK